jgi:hypothetical protein
MITNSVRLHLAGAGFNLGKFKIRSSYTHSNAKFTFMQDFQYTHLLPQDFDQASKVWIYQSNRLLTMSEALQTEDLLNDFTAGWKSHGAVVKGYGNLLFGQFVVLMADEKATGVSGCSTDSSVRLVKEIEKLFRINLFDRQLLAFVVKGKIQLIPLSQLKYAYDNEFINGDTIYFNNLVETKKDLESSWMIPVKESWLAGRLKSVARL